MTDLHTKAVRIHLLWGYWNPEKTDKQITEDTNKAHGVRSNRGHYDKALFSEEYMKRLRQHTSSTKTYYYTHTLPWEDRVARLISAEAVEKVAIMLNSCVQRYDEILHETVGDDEAYASAVLDQQSYMGTSWRQADYPKRKDFMARYHAHLDILPLVTTTDLRCNLSEGLKQQVITSIQRDQEERFRLAMADCWHKLYEPVRKMAEVLGNPDAKFKDTLVRNVHDICDVMPELNILDDPELKRMTEEIVAKLTVEPDVLRDSMVEREEYAKRSSELADMLSRMGISASRSEELGVS